MDGENLLHAFQARLRKAGPRLAPFHTLRHSAATMLLSQGLSLGESQEVLGHSQIALTANPRTHHTPEIARRAADSMDALFRTG